MDNAQKAIMLGVGLFITIIVIAAVMAITGIGQDLLNQGQNQLSGLSGQLASQVQSQYDQVKMSGTQVKTAINKYYNDNSLAVFVITEVGDDTKLNLSGKNGGAGTIASPYVVGQTALSYKSGSLQVNGSGVNLSSVVMQEAFSETNSQIPLSQLLSAVASNAQYKSALITNSTTGGIVGIVFARYQ